MAEDTGDKSKTINVNVVTAPIAMAIGHVAHHFSRLEFEINRTIWAIARVEPEQGACITAQIPSLISRLRALIALARQNDCSADTMKKLNKFTESADRAARLRNRIIHDPWFFRNAEDSDEFSFGHLEITADRKLTFAIQEKSVKEVLDIAQKLIELWKIFVEIREDLCREILWLRDWLREIDLNRS